MLALILLKFFVFTSPPEVGGGSQAHPAAAHSTSNPATAPATQKAPAEEPGLAPRSISLPGSR
jgi:hypothetical protein